jgi:hypothetical protein
MTNNSYLSAYCHVKLEHIFSAAKKQTDAGTILFRDIVIA